MIEIIEKNPYGAVSEAQLVNYENRIGCSLPIQYREYLLAANGGKFKNDCIDLGNSQGGTRIHHVYGLHSGPEYTRLTMDSVFKSDKSNFTLLNICDDAFSNLFYWESLIIVTERYIFILMMMSKRK